MNNKIICLLLSILLVFIFLVGCTGLNSEDVPKDELETEVFVIVEKGYTTGYYYSVVYHKQTKVMYILSNDNIATVMVDAEGNPVTYEGELK